MMRPQGCETLRAARVFKVEICVQSGRYAWFASFGPNKVAYERAAALVMAALGVALGRSFHPRSGSSDLFELVEAIRQWLQTTSPAPTRHETGGPALPVTSAGQSTTAVPYQPLQLHSAPHVSSAESQTEQESITAPHRSDLMGVHELLSQPILPKPVSSVFIFLSSSGLQQCRREHEHYFSTKDIK